MPEDYLFRRRNRLKKHFVVTSNVLLYGYHHLTDGAKLTYQVIDSFDWEDESKTSKGYAFPSVATIATARGVSERTIQRHLRELVSANLLTRQERPGETAVLIIEDVSQQQAQAYLGRWVDGGDVSVTPPPTNLSPEIRQSEENEILVNENHNNADRAGELPEVEEEEGIVRANVTPERRPDEETFAKREYYAQEVLKVLGDDHSLGCYRAIAAACPPDMVFEALSLVKETDRDGRIRRSKGALFVDIIKRLAKHRGIALPLRKAAVAELTLEDEPVAPIHAEKGSEMKSGIMGTLGGQTSEVPLKTRIDESQPRHKRSGP